jgi:CheY-like chemotaxis protein/HPt (histidine-containing phosphotransfer) domain-containing protein
VLARQLHSCGLEAHCVPDASEALAVLRQAYESNRPFDLALIDQSMPGTDGVELVRMIGCDTRHSSTRLVMLTASGRRFDTYAELGLAAILSKPVCKRELMEVLTLVLAGHAEDWQSQTSSVITRRLLSARRGREKHHILVAEDIPAGRMVACRTLEQLGFRVTGVSNGHEAIAAWQTGKYHLILMDCEMPEMDGYEATREIRRRESGDAHIPIVALTGRVMLGAERECREAGMDGYLVKPFDRERLEDCVDRLLGCDRIDIAATGILPNVRLSENEPVDLAALRTLAAGDETFMREIVHDFLQQCAAATDELNDALKKQDALALARIAHGVKTASGALGAKRLYTSVAQLEYAARDGSADRELVEKVQAEIAGAINRLSQWAA